MESFSDSKYIPEGVDSSLLLRAESMLQKHELPHPVDALFLHGRSYYDHDGLFEIISDFYQKGKIKFVVLPDSEGERFGGNRPREASPGKTVYIATLEYYGIPREHILIAGHAYHTKAENDAFLKLAKEKGWESVAVLTQAYQILRTMLGLIRTMQTQEYWVRAHPIVPEQTDWEKLVRGSQGMELKPRKEHIFDERKRIPIYQAKSDLASFEELFNYLAHFTEQPLF